MDVNEFVRQIPSFSSKNHPEKIKAFGWFLHTHAGRDRFTAVDVRRCYDDAHLDQPAIVQLDCGGNLQGYRGDLSRVLFLGEPDGKLRELFHVATEIYDRCLEQMRPGALCADIATSARSTSSTQPTGHGWHGRKGNAAKPT